MTRKTFVLTLFLAIALCLGYSGITADDQDKKAEDPKKSEITDKEAKLEHPIRHKDNPIVTLETNLGNLTLELYRDVAPAHADSFLARTEDGFYDSTIIHRIVKGFMAQGGNAAVVGKRPVSYTLNAEFNDLPHKEGTLSAARTRDPNSASTQFFICFGRNRSTASLDRQYTNYGQLLMGYDVLHKIEEIPVGPSRMMGGEVSQPLEEVRILKAYASDAQGNPLNKAESEDS
ncbi:MAG: peptidylprolyl isomerase [Candidatus Zixiibacteriota bacterium]|nr:MAG: peptidylprolyl isomerase [candidate division Zixibacteria bacterium]